MKKFLSILLFIAVFLTSFAAPSVVHAQNPPAATPTSAQDPAGSRWVVDPEVTFIGKNAARAGLMLDWTLQNYNWVCVNRLATGQCDDSKNPLAQFWGKIVVFIVVPLLFLVILITAGVIIITRGKSLTIMRFLPRFVAVILLIVFSYSILQFLYQFTDLIQGFFLRSNIDKDICPPNCISQKDLLYVGWDYEKFIGLRLLGDYNSESAFISLLLTKLTALTYFVMVGILLIRKIILWFFIIVAPIFPILLLFYPVRNTGKIWIGEFFRWLLYAPLFAIFLQGLVSMWRTQIPLIFKPQHGEVVGKDIIYPTAVNILLGGPQQFVTTTNSVNLTETFALYVVALIMLWIVILLPWILLQIFLDYASNFSPGDSTVMKSLVNMANKQIAPVGPAGYPPATPPPGGGAAISLPFAKKFAVPTSLQPGGAAKEITRDAATASRFATPISLPVAQVQTQSLKLANVPLPTMRDIAKYDTALLSNDKSRQQEVSRVRETLEKIANPASTTSTVERERFQSIHDKLGQESQQGNLLANSILNAVSTVSRQNVKASTSQVKNVMQQIANPASATNLVDRQKLTKLHDTLQKESKQNNNELAKSILSVNQNTSDKEIEQIREKLEHARGQNNPIANTVLSNISSAQQKEQKTTQVKNVLQQMTNPQSATNVTDREKLSKLKDNLTQASKDGNQLAASILAVSDKTSNAEIEKLQERIREAKAKGEPIANQVAALTQKAADTTLPAVNRVQTVNKDDYDAVRSMWKENYQNLEVPQGMAGSRSEWIKDDIAKIDNIVGLLSSSDQEKVEEGMQEVSNILPFLLVGGFSQTEIVAYLKAKQDAAKEIVTVLAQDEEQKVSVETHVQHAEKAMAASMETSPTDRGDEDDSPLSSISMSTTNITQPQVSNEILALVEIKLPKMKDIVRYETRAMAKDESQVAEAKKVHSVLEKVANPSMVSDSLEREKFTKLREKLLEESGKGNITAEVILSAAAGAAKTEAPILPGRSKAVLAQIANPSSAVSEAEKKRYAELHDKLQKASQEGNELAKEILSTQDATSLEDIQKLNAKLKEAKDKGEDVASSVLSSLSESVAPAPSNKLQSVSDEDYDEVRKLWDENYRNLPVPQPFTGDVKGRIEWIKDDSAKVQHTIDLLVSNELEKRSEGMKQVAEILPFLLLGGFSNEEMVGYLKAKLEAANTVSADLQKQEEGQVHVDAGANQAEQAKEMQQEIDKKE